MAFLRSSSSTARRKNSVSFGIAPGQPPSMNPTPSSSRCRAIAELVLRPTGSGPPAARRRAGSCRRRGSRRAGPSGFRSGDRVRSIKKPLGVREVARRAGLDALGNDDLVGDRKQLHGRHAATAVRILATVLAIWIPTTGVASAATVDPFVGSGGGPPFFSGNTHPPRPARSGWCSSAPTRPRTPAAHRPPALGLPGRRATPSRLLGHPPVRRGLPAPSATCRSSPSSAPSRTDPGAATVAMDKASERADPGRYAVSARQRRGRLDGGRRPQRAAALRPPADRAGPRAGQGRRQPGRHPSASSARFLNRPRDRRARDQRRLLRSIRRVHRARRCSASTSRSAGTAPGVTAARGSVRPGPGRPDPGRRLVRRVSAAHDGTSRPTAPAGRSPGWAGRPQAVWAGRCPGPGAHHRRQRAGAQRSSTPRSTASSCTRPRSATPTAATPASTAEVHRLRGGERQLSAISGWDYYRTHAPLLAWIRPDVAARRWSGRCCRTRARAGACRSGRWSARETHIMNGDSAAPAIATTYAFGARDFDSTRSSPLVRQGDVVRTENGSSRDPGSATTSPGATSAIP